MKGKWNHIIKRRIRIRLWSWMVQDGTRTHAGPGGISTCVCCCCSRASSDIPPNCGRNVIGGGGGGGSRSGLSVHGDAVGHACAFVQLVKNVGMKSWSGSVWSVVGGLGG